MWLTRLLLIVATGIAGLIGFTHLVNDAKYFAILAAVCSAISGWLGIRLAEEDTFHYPTDGRALVALRSLIHNDKQVAILELQLAVIFSALATLLS